MSEYFENNDWKQKRLGRFTASEIWKLFQSGKRPMTEEELAEEKKNKGKRKTVDTLFGETALTYIYEKAAEVLTQEVKEEISAKALEWGKAHEHEAVQAFESKMNYSGIGYGLNNPVFFEHGDFSGCSPDWEMDFQDYRIGAEIKCPYNSAEHLKNLLINSQEDFYNLRYEYYCQIQHNMLIRGWHTAYFVSYDPRFVFDKDKLFILPVTPDVGWQREYIDRSPKAIDLLKSIVGQFVPAVGAEYDTELQTTIIS